VAVQVSEITQTRDVVGRRPVMTTALRFAVVGVGGVAVNTLALHVLFGLAHLPLLAASPMSVELAIAHNYVLNDRWTFRQRRRSLGRFARFNASAVVTLLVNVAVVWLLVTSGVNYMAANLAGVGAGALLNWGASSAWVWRATT
jgi:putative flippase GtrA